MAKDVQSFEFKPALLRSRDNWTLDGGFLTRNGELFCNLADISGARFAEMSVRHTHSAWFDLQFEGGRHRIACNMPPGDRSYCEFMRLCVAALDELGERNPELKVTFGAAGAIRWSMFTIGLLALIFGVVVWLILAGGGVDRNRQLMALVFGGAFALSGAGLAWSYRPWAPPSLLPVETARILLERLSLHGHPKSAEGDEEDDEDKKG